MTAVDVLPVTACTLTSLERQEAASCGRCIDCGGEIELGLRLLAAIRCLSCRAAARLLA